MKIILTGATGFLGSYMLKRLVNEGIEVIVLKRSFSSIDRIKNELEQVMFYDLDSSTIAEIFELEKGVDGIIHTATLYGQNNSVADVISSNILFTANLIERGKQRGVSFFINTDSFITDYFNTYEYLKAYTLSKHQTIQWLKLIDGIKVINMKLFHMYGPGDDDKKFIPWIVGEIISNKSPIPMTKGEQIRDYVYVDDVVSAFLQVLNNIDQLKKGFIEFEIGTGIGHSLIQLVSIIKEESNSNSQFEFGKIPYRKGEIMKSVANNNSLNALSWSPVVTLNEGIEYLIASLIPKSN